MSFFIKQTRESHNTPTKLTPHNRFYHMPIINYGHKHGRAI